MKSRVLTFNEDAIGHLLRNQTMTSTVFKIAIASILALSVASPGIAETKQAVTTTQSTPTADIYVTEVSRAEAASICAMDLAPKAQSIFDAVASKVEPDTNLKKLVKKHVRPKVLSGKLSVKSARKNAQAASACLRILKHGSPEER